MKIVLLLFVVTAVAVTTVFSQSCQRNEEYQTCGSACQESCNSGPNTFCTYQCGIGCFCRRGFKRNRSGSCVRPNRC
ncbi:unnamed protein product [Tenebrio molitor]|nr:unnamed protein product [Tenebrio molitor]